jgi:hypothetical protein
MAGTRRELVDPLDRDKAPIESGSINVLQAGVSRPWTSAGGAVASTAVKGSMIVY